MPTTSDLIPHVHISAIEGFKVFLYFVVFVGVLHVIARKFEGHPLADTILDIWA